MKIIILGASHVGGSLARILADEANDITLVDEDIEKLRRYQEQADLKIVSGFPSHPDVLQSADAENADMLIALTPSDEVNMVACRVANTIFNTPKKIARIHSTQYLDHSDLLFKKDAVPIDMLINPERLVSENIARLIDYPGAFEVVEFARRYLLMVAMKAERGGRLIDRQVGDIPSLLPDVEVCISAIYRDTEFIIPGGTTRLHSNDEIFFLAAPEHVPEITLALRNARERYSRIVIAGGGRIGAHLAETLNGRYKVKIIEQDQSRASYLAEYFNHVLVLHGDASSEEILREENIDHADVFCALTSDDEDNILSAMLAKHLGARKVMALVNRTSYVEMMRESSIDITISPQKDSIGALLRHIRKGDLVKVHSLRYGAAEAIEGIAHGDSSTSQLVGRRVQDIRPPRDATINAVVRGDRIFMAYHNVTIEPGDHVILFLSDKRRIPEVEKLFQVSATFI